MTQPHTPEPWVIGDAKDFKAIGILSRDNSLKGVFYPKERVDFICLISQKNNITPTDLANAERIVLCVNALAGITDPAKQVEAWKQSDKTIDTLLLERERMKKEAETFSELLMQMKQELEMLQDIKPPSGS